MSRLAAHLHSTALPRILRSSNLGCRERHAQHGRRRCMRHELYRRL